MQNQKQIPVSQTLSDVQASGPCEIDASLLHLVSGGAPKSTWTEPQALVATSTSSNQAPKSTW